MIYDLANTVLIGKPIRVFDANGQEINYTIEVDTETGRVVKLKRDGRNFVLDQHRESVLREEVYFPAPLRVEPK